MLKRRLHSTDCMVSHRGCTNPLPYEFHHMRRVEMDVALLDEVLGAWQAQWPDVAVMALLPEREVVRLPVLQGICRRRGISLFGGVFP